MWLELFPIPVIKLRSCISLSSFAVWPVFIYRDIGCTALTAIEESR